MQMRSEMETDVKLESNFIWPVVLSGNKKAAHFSGSPCQLKIKPWVYFN